MPAVPAVAPLRIIGRYAIHEALAAGGMATVHLGRLRGPVGFSRTVAIKRLHPQYASDPEFVAAFLDEARLAARIRHPNVVPTLDVVATDGEIFIVMEFVHGESLARLLKMHAEKREPIPPRIGAAILRDALQGLHAAHDAKDEQGVALGIVHRDVSPQNIIVGVDGVARVFDFGIAKAAGRSQVTREGQIKGKLAYMAPEQLTGEAVTRVTDVFAASIVLWETLAGRRLFSGDSEGIVVTKVLQSKIKPPSEVVAALGDRYDALVMKGLDRDATKRFPSAREMAQALAKVEDLADAAEVGEWLERVAHPTLAERAKRVADVESAPSLPAGSPMGDDEHEERVVKRSPLLDPDVATVAVRTADATAAELSRDDPGPRPAPRRWPMVGAVGLVVVGLAITLFAFGRSAPAPLAIASPPIEPVPIASPSSSSPPLIIPTAVASAQIATTASAIASVPPKSRPASTTRVSPRPSPSASPASPASPSPSPATRPATPRTTSDSIPEHL